MNKKRICIFTNDVETTSLWNNCLSDETGEKVFKQGIPGLIEIFNKYNIKTTFFFTGYFVEKFPEAVKLVHNYGHEVGCHGYYHDVENAYDVLPYNIQLEQLKKCKANLEKIIGHTITSFRAPALRVNNDTALALSEAGFKIDSSICPQRADFVFSFGSKQKIKWLTANRKPYISKKTNLFEVGDDGVFEIPLSAMLLPYIGTFMRISPTITSTLRFFLHFESSITGKPIVFLIHPNEVIIEKIKNRKVNRRSKSFIGYLIKDYLRYKLKLKNLGENTLVLLEKQIKFFKKQEYEFLTMEQYYNLRIKDGQ